MQCNSIQYSWITLLIACLLFFKLLLTLKPSLYSSTFSHFLLPIYSLRYLTEAEPWKMKGENESRRPAIVRTTLEALYAFTHLLAPVLPIAAQIGINMLIMMCSSHHLTWPYCYSTSFNTPYCLLYLLSSHPTHSCSSCLFFLTSVWPSRHPTRASEDPKGGLLQP